MARQPRSGRSVPSEFTDEPMPEALTELLRLRGLTVTALGSLLRAEGIAISRSRLHQLQSGQGAAPSAEQIERIASVLGVGPSYFAEYRLWRTRALLDPALVGFDRAMVNFERLRGRRALAEAGPDAPGRPSRYPPRRRRAAEERG
jgi:transcriptional regulator with XRE-family HTH domain